jgi:hypothetical protein
MTLHGLTVEHPPWSSFGDGEAIAAYGLPRRLATVVPYDGAVVIEGVAILNLLDEMAGPNNAMLSCQGDTQE